VSFKLLEETLLCYLMEAATGYFWSAVPYFVLFGTALQSHFTEGFLHQPAGRCSLICHSITSPHWWYCGRWRVFL